MPRSRSRRAWPLAAASWLYRGIAEFGLALAGQDPAVLSRAEAEARRPRPRDGQVDHGREGLASGLLLTDGPPARRPEDGLVLSDGPAARRPEAEDLAKLGGSAAGSGIPGQGPRPDLGPDGVDIDAISRTVAHLATVIRGPLRRLSVHWGEMRIELRWAELSAGAPPSGVAAAAGTTAEDEGGVVGLAAGLDYICSPVVGTFYRGPEPGAPPFVAVGDTVEAGQQVGIVEAMKLMNRVEADRGGRVIEVLVPDAGPVEYGQRLVGLAPLQGP